MKDSSWIFGSMTFHACSCQISLEFVIGSSPEMKIIFLSEETALARTNRRYLLKYYGIYFVPEFVRFPAANFSKLFPYHKAPSLSHPRMCYNNFRYLHAERAHEVDKFYFTISVNIFCIIYHYYSFYVVMEFSLCFVLQRKLIRQLFFCSPKKKNRLAVYFTWFSSISMSNWRLLLKNEECQQIPKKINSPG